MDSAFLLLVGLVLAGLIHLVVNEKNIARLTGGGRTATVFKAALIGIPLPLCSCSVLPVAHQLRRSGLSRGGTAAFLISTPETGVDSIMLTYALADPLLTIARPIAAFASAITAGLLVEATATAPAAQIAVSDAVKCNCGCYSAEIQTIARRRWPTRIMNGLRYAFVDLLGDIAIYLLIGYVLAGVADVLFANVLSGNIPETLKNGFGAYLGAILVGVPLYVCATSSTPMAAVLLGAGFSPGAILVFLMVGPATNAASLAVITKVLDRKSTVIYLASIVAVAICFGLLTDSAYRFFDISANYRLGSETAGHDLLAYFSAIVLSSVILLHPIRKLLRRLT